MAPLLKFKAGRMDRIGNTNTVMADESRGLIYLQEEDGLLHFLYKNLLTDETDDLIIFPGDATYTKVSAASRVYCLKFSSSSTRSFFYFQDVDDSLDEERAKKVNELIGAQLEEEPPAVVSSGDVEMEGPIASTSTSSALPLAIPSTTTSTETPSILGTADQLSQMQNFLASFASGTNPLTSRGVMSAESQMPEYTLPAVLPSSLLLPLLSKLSPSALSSLASYLPTTPLLPPTTDSLSTAISSPEFKRSVASLDRALRSGALGPLVRGLGLGEESAVGVEAFLEGIQKQAEKEKEKGKETKMEE